LMDISFFLLIIFFIFYIICIVKLIELRILEKPRKTNGQIIIKL